MRIILGSVILASSFALGCGGDVIIHQSGPQPDGGDTSDTSVMDMPDTSPPEDAAPPPFPAFKIDPPQVVTNGGAILANPKLIPVFFQNDDPTFTAKLVDFLGKLPASKYWPPPTMEYGVGTPTLASSVNLSENAVMSTSDSAIQSWLKTKLSSGDPLWPAPDANSLYILYYPTGTSITLGGGTSCNSFGGYHSGVAVNGQNVAYAVLPRCSSFAGMFGISATTATSTHEIIEAATDPYPNLDPAYAGVDANHIVWQFNLGGGEVGDMCTQFQGSFFKPAEFAYAYGVQATWSNTAAKAAHNPCVPYNNPNPYFNSMPVLPDTISIGMGSTKGVKIPVGMSKTIQVELFSDAPAPPWTVKAYEAQMGTDLQFSWDKTGGKNGDILNLTIKVLTAGKYGAESFFIDSDNGVQVYEWIGLVGN